MYRKTFVYLCRWVISLVHTIIKKAHARSHINNSIVLESLKIHNNLTQAMKWINKNFWSLKFKNASHWFIFVPKDDYLFRGKERKLSKVKKIKISFMTRAKINCTENYYHYLTHTFIFLKGEKRVKNILYQN